MRLLAGHVGCNATGVYSLAQAVLAADAGARAVSVGVGAVSDHWRTQNPSPQHHQPPAHEDRGVLLCAGVHATLHALEYTTTRTVAAGCRTAAQALALTGVDAIALTPRLLRTLACRDAADVVPRLPRHPRTTADQYMLRPATAALWPREAASLLRQQHNLATDAFADLKHYASIAIEPFVQLEA